MSSNTMPVATVPSANDLAIHVDRLERDGWTIIPGFLDSGMAARLRAHMDALLSPQKNGEACFLHHPIPGEIMVEMITDEHLRLAATLLHAPVCELRLIEQVFIRSDPAGRSGPHKYHIDCAFPNREIAARPRQTYFQCIHALCDIPSGRSATMVVPGSHHRTRMAAEELDREHGLDLFNASEATREEIVRRASIDTSLGIELTAREGDLVVIDPMCVHTGSHNNTDQSRYVFFQTFTTANARTVLDLCLTQGKRQPMRELLRPLVPPELRALLDG